MNRRYFLQSFLALPFIAPVARVFAKPSRSQPLTLRSTEAWEMLDGAVRKAIDDLAKNLRDDGLSDCDIIGTITISRSSDYGIGRTLYNLGSIKNAPVA